MGTCCVTFSCPWPFLIIPLNFLSYQLWMTMKNSFIYLHGLLEQKDS